MPLSWENSESGLLRLPSGRVIRGRGLRYDTRPESAPDFGLYLLGARPREMDWESRWLRWRDFWLPSDPVDFADALQEIWVRAASERVEVACGGGRGRTGTAMACLAIIDGVPPIEAVAYVRTHYAPRAIETPWQRRFVVRFRPAGSQ